MAYDCFILCFRIPETTEFVTIHQVDGPPGNKCRRPLGGGTPTYKPVVPFDSEAEAHRDKDPEGSDEV